MNDKKYAVRTLKDGEIKLNHNLIQVVYKLMKSVNMLVSMNELEQTVGYYRVNGFLHHRLKPLHVESLLAIVHGDLKKLKQIHSKKRGMMHYKDLNIRLAVKYEHMHIINYLAYTGCWINRDMNHSVADCASLEMIKKFEVNGFFDECRLPPNTIQRRYENMKKLSYTFIYNRHRPKNMDVANYIKEKMVLIK